LLGEKRKLAHQDLGGQLLFTLPTFAGATNAGSVSDRPRRGEERRGVNDDQLACSRADYLDGDAPGLGSGRPNDEEPVEVDPCSGDPRTIERAFGVDPCAPGPWVSPVYRPDGGEGDARPPPQPVGSRQLDDPSWQTVVRERRIKIGPFGGQMRFEPLKAWKTRCETLAERIDSCHGLY
jgi:hypothetical protein